MYICMCSFEDRITKQYGLHMEHIGVLSKVILYVLQVGCIVERGKKVLHFFFMVVAGRGAKSAD